MSAGILIVLLQASSTEYLILGQIITFAPPCCQCIRTVLQVIIGAIKGVWCMTHGHRQVLTKWGGGEGGLKLITHVTCTLITFLQVSGLSNIYWYIKITLSVYMGGC